MTLLSLTLLGFAIRVLLAEPAMANFCDFSSKFATKSLRQSVPLLPQTSYFDTSRATLLGKRSYQGSWLPARNHEKSYWQAEPAIPWVPRQSQGTRTWLSRRPGQFEARCPSRCAICPARQKLRHRRLGRSERNRVLGSAARNLQLG